MKSNEHNMIVGYKSNAKVEKISRSISSSNVKRTADCERNLKEDNDANMQVMEHESESGFEETCVLVDRNDYCPENHKQEIRPSYKKIKNAFSLKNKSTRKHEYKQQNEKRIIEEADKDIPLAITPSNDSLDSEWELL